MLWYDKSGCILLNYLSWILSQIQMWQPLSQLTQHFIWPSYQSDIGKLGWLPSEHVKLKHPRAPTVCALQPLRSVWRQTYFSHVCIKLSPSSNFRKVQSCHPVLELSLCEPQQYSIFFVFFKKEGAIKSYGKSQYTLNIPW